MNACDILTDQHNYVNYLIPEIKNALLYYIQLNQKDEANKNSFGFNRDNELAPEEKQTLGELTTWLDNIFNTAPITTQPFIVYYLTATNTAPPRGSEHIITYCNVNDSPVPIKDSILYSIIISTGSKILPIDNIILLWNKGKLIVTKDSYENSHHTFDTIYIPPNSIDLSEHDYPINHLKMSLAFSENNLAKKIVNKLSLQGSVLCSKDNVKQLVDDQLKETYGKGNIMSNYPLHIVDDAYTRLINTGCRY